MGDDVCLREHLAAVYATAIILRRPVAEVWKRIAILGLEKPAPAAFVKVGSIGAEQLFGEVTR